MTSIANNLAAVRARIERACARAGRDPAGVRLVAVSKTRGAGEVREALRAGQRLFGENYVQELVEKQDGLAGIEGEGAARPEWHFIGHLQRNKVKQVVGRVSLVQSVDSVRLLEELDRRAGETGTRCDLLVEVNLAAEESKSGCGPAEAAGIVARAAALGHVACRGLMVIPPFDLDAETARGWFKRLKALREELGGAGRLPELSMGMSGDFEEAIEEGATIVRVGTAIFGGR